MLLPRAKVTLVSDALEVYTFAGKTMMSASPDILPYFGPTPPRTPLFRRVARGIGNAIVLLILAIVITARFALLAAGYACVFAGTLLLMLGGRRSAAQKLSRWRAKASELLKLWLADMARPLRR